MYVRRPQGILKNYEFIIADLVALHISFIIAYMIRHGAFLPYTVPIYRTIAVVMTLVSILVSAFTGSFRNALNRGYYLEFVSTLKQTLIFAAIMLFYMFALQQSYAYSRITILLTDLFYLVLGYIFRIILKLILRNRHAGRNSGSLIIVTTRDMAAPTVRALLNDHNETYHINGLVILDEQMTGQSIEGISVVSDADNIIDYILPEWIDEVFINAPTRTRELNDLIKEISETGIVLHVRFEDEEKTLGSQQFIENFGSYTVMTSTINTMTFSQRFIKRTADIIIGIIGSILTLLLLPVMGIMIAIQSPGPVFFKQVRVGKNGRKFEIYKFRTMYMDAEERKKDFLAQNRSSDGMMFKLDFDPRIIGNKVLPDGTEKRGFFDFARRASLDEFPQFFNILLGQMSVCGTRPPTIDEWEKYELRHRARIAMRPGLTGLWQVSGRSEITNFDEVVKLDLEYITKWNFGLDIKIILKTIGLIFSHKGSL